MHHQSTTQVHIYTLSDPASGAVRYVGQSANTQARLREHLHSATAAKPDNVALANWVLTLRDQGKQPMLHVVQTVRADLGAAAECAHIAAYHHAGAQLFNIYGRARTGVVLALNGLLAGYARLTLVPTPELVMRAEVSGCSVAQALSEAVMEMLEESNLARPMGWEERDGYVRRCGAH